MSALFYLLAFACWCGALSRIVGLGGSRNSPARRATWITLALLGLAFAVLPESSRPSIDDLTGVRCSARWFGNSCTLAAAFCIQGVFERFANRGESAPLIGLTRLFCFVGVVSMMAVLIFSAQPRDDVNFIEVNASNGAVLSYLLLNLSYLGVVMAQAFRATLRYAPHVSSSALRLGLRLIAIGSACGVTFCVYKAVVAVSVFLGFPGLYAEKIVGPSLGLLSAAHIVAGLTTASRGSGVADMVRRRVALRRLEPMWKELIQAVPQVVLEVGHQNQTERLYRKIIEIRDAQLALNAYQNDDLRRRVRTVAQARGFSGSGLNAAIEGTLLSLTLAAMRAGSEASSPPTKSMDGYPPADLMSECKWLEQVSVFFRAPLLEAPVASPE
ncbi:MAB_1171c family putative transporter [Actinomadura gamaensis]|uniref:MAB_1171c family putative transporter n=1 Tax=Actinomadura gamaensis TaxID=1763541 RepID=A0ABV9U9Y6_9ACTN